MLAGPGFLESYELYAAVRRLRIYTDGELEG